MRHGRKAPDISDIYPSIRTRGVQQPLLVRREGKKWGVVAGRRRFFALKRLAKETGDAQKAPCAIIGEGDDAAAIEVSILENVARLPAEEFEQFNAFKRLADKGRGPAEIADTFGVTELKVKRILALADLSDGIKTLYEQEEIDRRTLYALTLASDEQQADWLKLYHSEAEYAPRGERLKEWLTGGGRITTDKALFDLAHYDGVILTDLFGENATFGDTDYFWACQNEAIAAKVSSYRSDGWNEVIVLERGAHFLKWEHGTRARKEAARSISRPGMTALSPPMKAICRSKTSRK